MKFIIHNLLLWANNGVLKNLNFIPNKVNVITGGSGTGKSSLLGIIDYCLCASKPKIPFEIINENIGWYGLKLTIGESIITIARGKVEEGNKPSTSYFLSSEGVIPVLPDANINEEDLKALLQKLFNIDPALKISYGGRNISANSKISFRYFLLFNTQSDKVITNDDQFFDKIEQSRYKEYLDRIFDLVLGVDNQEDLLRKSQIESLRAKNNKLDRQEKSFSKQKSIFENRIINLISEAQSYGLVETTLPTIDEGIKRLENMVESYGSSVVSGVEEIDELNSQKRDLLRKLRNITSFKREYESYRLKIRATEDSLLPIQYIKEDFDKISISSETSAIINAIETELFRIKEELAAPNDLIISNIDSEERILQARLRDIDEKLQVNNNVTTFFKDQIEKYIFIGQAKAMLSIYVKESITDIFSADRKKNNDLISKIMADIVGDGDRNGAIDRLQELIQIYLDASSESLGNYSGYKALVNFNDKSLLLRAPSSVLPTKVGSSSNYMFLHICFFLGMHEYFLERGNSYVPQLLIIDQLSRPYYESSDESTAIEISDLKRDRAVKSTDKSKLVNAFGLLDLFLTRAKDLYSKDFQFILIEHVKPAMWNEAKLQNFHLVSDLRDSEGIITEDMIVPAR